MGVLESGSHHLIRICCDGSEQFWYCCEGKVECGGDGGIDGFLMVDVVSVLEFFIHHELNSTVNYTKETRSESFVESRDTFILWYLNKGIHHAWVVTTGIKSLLLLKTNPRIRTMLLCFRWMMNLVLTTVMGLVKISVMRPATEAARRCSPVASCLSVSPSCSRVLMVWNTRARWDTIWFVITGK